MADHQGPTLHGLFSEQAANQFGSGIYSTPDGREVEVTHVHPSEGARFHYGWEDEISVGEVKKFLRKGRAVQCNSSKHFKGHYE